MDRTDQSAERTSLMEWYEKFRADQAAKEAQIKKEAMEKAKATIEKYKQDLREQEVCEKAARKARSQAVVKGCQSTPVNSRQSPSQVKASEKKGLFINSVLSNDPCYGPEKRTAAITTSRKHKSGGIIIGEGIGKPKPVVASSLAPAKRKWMKNENPSERKLLATNASIEAPLYRTPGLRKPDSTSTSHATPEWYSAINAADNRYRSDSLTLRGLHRLVTKALSSSSNCLEMEQACGYLRNFLHQMALFDFGGKEKEIIKRSMLLTDGIFDTINKRPFPMDIRDITISLKRRWWEGDTDPNLMRGVKKSVSKTKDGSSHTIYNLDSCYAFKVSPNYNGHGNLIVGQWWPLQICAVRDGAHGDIEAGIHGLKAQGAFSIVVSGGGYANIDEGDDLHYCGTANIKNTPSQGTNLMLVAHQKHQPIRVIRSSKARSQYSPSTGLRYDGLYQIISYEIIDVETALHRFTLKRKSGQPPVHYEGPAARPNEAEVEAMERDKLLRAPVP